MRLQLAQPLFKPFYIAGLRLVILFLLLSFQFSCGFHLRGAYPLPESMSATYIKASNQNSELVRHLKRTLNASDIELVNSEQQASGILHIDTEKQSKRVLSVDSRGRAREYELSYEISFELRSLQGKVEIEKQSLKLVRDFLFDTEDVLGKGREETDLVRDMQQDMVRLMMLRLSRQKKTEQAIKPLCQEPDCQQGNSSE